METGMDTATAGARSDGGFELGVDRTSSPTPALRGGRVGREAWTGATDGEGLAKMLAWFSIGLGTAELIAPDGVGRMIGLHPGRTSRTVIRAMGVREIGAGLALLAQPRSKEWLGMRIDGDLLDLGLLAAALVRAEKPSRTLMAAAAVLGVTALDVAGTEELSRSRKTPGPWATDESGKYVRKSVTVWRPRSEVYAAWRDFTQLPRFMENLESVEMIGPDRSRWRARGPGGTVEWEAETVEDVENEGISWRSVGSPDVYNSGVVAFGDAPGGGTVVTVELRYAPPGGALGSALLRLFRKEPRQQVADDLRRFKQIMELGDVVVSGREEVAP